MALQKPQTIIIADPDGDFRRSMSDVLVPQGKKTLTVDHGTRATELIEEAEGRIDFLIIAHQIPPIDSYWVLQWIREMNYDGNFHIMVVSDVEEPDYVIKELKDSGASSFVTKDIPPAQISYIMNQIIFRSTQEPSQRALPRIPVSISIDFKYDRHTGAGHITNLSESGFYLHTLSKLKESTVINTVISLSGAKKPLNVSGQVMRQRSVGRRHDNVFSGVGITFAEISEEDKITIRNFLSKLAGRLGLS